MQQRLHLGLSMPTYTPPSNGATHLRGQQTRAQSVIVKIQNDGRSNYVFLDELSHESYLSDEATKLPFNDSTGDESLLPFKQTNDYLCEWLNCGRSFESLESLASHVTQMHATGSLPDGLFYCRWSGCQRTLPFNARYKMLVHIRTHTKEKPHQCVLCHKRFSRAENLKIHIRSHSGEKPYMCTFKGCNKAYSNSSDRFKHTRTHTMEKPYMCKMPGCQKRYTDPSSLRKHIKTTKHSQQFIISTIESKEGRWTNDTLDNTYCCQYSIVPAISNTHPDSFCISMEDMCNIKCGHLGNYWHNKEMEETTGLLYGRTQTLKCEKTYAIKMDINSEKPLDLTVKQP